MICKNCANIFSDDLELCPDCGTPVKKRRKEVETEENEIDALVSLALSEFEDISSQVDEDIDSVAEIIKEEKEDIYSYDRVPSDELTEDEARESKNKKQQVRKKPATKKLQRDINKNKMTKKEKSAVNFIIALMTVIFVFIGALAVISATTDIFEKDEDSVMAVALSGFSSEETAELEEVLSKMAYIAYSGFDRDKNVIVDVMEYLRPDMAGGLYSRFYGQASLTVNEADPDCRFTNENGDYNYYVLEAERVDAILAYFGFEPNHNVNEKNFYYYAGKYYFANLGGEDFGSNIYADVSSSKRIQDGSYYVECSYFDGEGTSSNKEYLDTYIILNREKNEETGEITWTIKSISHQAVFDASGFMIKDESGENELSYEIRTETIEVRTTKKNRLLIKYVIEYPYFKGSTEGEKAVNRFYTDLIEDYRSQAESIKNPNKYYQRFLKKGGTNEELPLVTQVVSRVSYNRNGYISIVEGISEYTPKAANNILIKNEDGSFEVIEPVNQQNESILPERSIEGYIFEVETGEFLSKNEIISADYQLAHDILYRIYSGYEYESLVNGEEEEDSYEEEIPEDKEEIGKAIYESSSAMANEGYVFCYINPKGYTESVVIPYTLESFFSDDYSVRTNQESE